WAWPNVRYGFRARIRTSGSSKESGNRTVPGTSGRLAANAGRFGTRHGDNPHLTLRQPANRHGANPTLRHPDNPPGMTVVRDAWRVIGLQHRQDANHLLRPETTGGLSVSGTD